MNSNVRWPTCSNRSAPTAVSPCHLSSKTLGAYGLACTAKGAGCPLRKRITWPQVPFRLGIHLSGGVFRFQLARTVHTCLAHPAQVVPSTYTRSTMFMYINALGVKGCSFRREHFPRSHHMPFTPIVRRHAASDERSELHLPRMLGFPSCFHSSTDVK